ncbi:MAG: hypothetical protein Q8M22_08730 [Actinomycetota bacterium]|nr:hypothetical protein [Actinomycetota bacterium]
MSATLPAGGTAVAVSGLLAGAGLAVAAATRRDPRRRRVWSERVGRIDSRRGSLALVTAVLVLFATRWPILALAAGTLVMCWSTLVHDGQAELDRRHVDGLAKWLEDLRDTLRSSSMGIEEALERVALRPPVALSAALTAFLRRRQQGFPTDDALTDLAEDLAHPTADAAIAVIHLVIGGSASPGRLHRTIHALALAARSEVAARERIDRTRAMYRSSMKRLVVIGAALIGYLRLAGGELLQPYDRPAGQLFLVVPLSMWTGCLLWMRALCRSHDPRRHRFARASAAVR